MLSLASTRSARLASIAFGVSKDSTSFFGDNARYSTVRWVAFSSCQTLRAGPFVSATPANTPLADWFNAFQGAHLLLGFHSNVVVGPSRKMRRAAIGQ